MPNTKVSVPAPPPQARPALPSERGIGSQTQKPKQPVFVRPQLAMIFDPVLQQQDLKKWLTKKHILL